MSLAPLNGRETAVPASTLEEKMAEPAAQSETEETRTIEAIKLSPPGLSSPRSRAKSHSASQQIRGSVEAVLTIPRLGTWAGLALVTGGFAIIVLGWSKAAGVLNVGLQMPYVISAGLGGLALVVVGLTLIGIDAKVADARLRTAQIVELRDLLARLSSSSEVRS